MVTCSQLSFTSNTFSSISLLSWTCAQLPQIYTNFRNKSAEGISSSFLMLWFLGDLLSVTSCLLNDVVLKFQIYLSLFFLCNDAMLCFQYYYYNSVYPRKYGIVQYANCEPRESSDLEICSTVGKYNNGASIDHDTSVHTEANSIHIIQTNNSTSDKLLMKQAGQSISSSNSPNGSYSSINDNQPSIIKSLVVGSILNITSSQALPLLKEIDTDTTYSLLNSTNLGLYLAWGCTMVYVSSRCPQLFKNYKRKSVEGISPILFGSALIGNLTYTLSILTSCDFVFEDSKADFLLRELPYIIGSSGTVVFDIAYFYQKYLYINSGKNTIVMSLDNWENTSSFPNTDGNSLLI